MSDNELYSAAAKLFAAHNRWEDVGEAESTGWAPQLWKALQQSGFSDVPVPEELGGAGGSVADAVQLLRAAGAHAAPVPLAESGLVGGWLLASAGLALPEGVRTVLPPAATLRLDGDRLFGTAPAVAWGHRAQHVVGLVGGVIVLVPGPAAQSVGPAVSRGANLADEPRDTVVFDGVPITARADAPEAVTEETLWERTALGRAALMAGAISAVAAMTLRYSGEREQFGRPIARFQAVQAHLVTIHQQAAVVTAAAHQTHGAIGMTKEYPLHYLTRRLWAWRDEAGGHHRWADRLGAALVACGPDALYPAIQSGSEVMQ
jgi:acyl-CoA dehydrogenase